MLHINTNGIFNAPYMYSSIIGTEDASTLSGLPIKSDPFYAYREVFFIPNDGLPNNDRGKIIVRITEAYPNSGRIWISSYNTDTQSWSAWAVLEPKYMS